MKVLKFGGTSVNDSNSISKLVEIVRAELDKTKPLVVVTSAMGGVTNQLLEMAYNAEKGWETDRQLKEVLDRHLEVIQTLIPEDKQDMAATRIKLFFSELEKLLLGVRMLKEISPRTKDSIVSYGELCSTWLVCEVLSQYEPKTRYVDARELFITDSQFGNAKINTQETETNIRHYFSNISANLYCVTGFIASDNEGCTTTLGRGGSDYTAAFIGAVQNAEEIQIWTDVDGFLTADPRLVRKAFSLPEISYTEAKELTYFGAKVIYPPTMIPAFAKRIPIRIRNTFNLDFPGTVIHDKAGSSKAPVRGITSIKDVVLINIQGSGLMGYSGFSGRLFSLLAREGVNIILITQASSEHSITFAVSPEDAYKAEKVLQREFEMELAAQKIDEPEIVTGKSVLAIVGENMKRSTGTSGILFHALGRNGVNVTAIAQGSSEYNISVVIDNKDLAKALNVVHEAFFLSEAKTINVFFAGIGNVGKTLLKQLQAQEEWLLENNNLRIQLIGMINSRRMLFKPGGFETADWERLFEEESEAADLSIFVERMKELNLANSVFVDNSASERIVAFYEGIFNSNISVVTCNKIGNSSSYEQYKTYKEAVRKHGVDFLYETNVGAGLPVIKTLQDMLISGDRIQKIEAILSGTISFIFNNFSGDKSFHSIVKEAQEKGYTEPDPRDDLSGLDFKRKMLILARDSGYPLEMEDIQMQPILPDSVMSAPDIPSFYVELEKADAHFEKLKKDAEAADKKLRLIGIMEDGKVSIELKAVDNSHPFYSLSGSDNIIAFTSLQYSGNSPLVVKGPGAGGEVTAAGVFADLVKVGSQG